MKKLFKRITATCVAVIMMTAVLCTYASASVLLTITGSSGNYNLHYDYSVGDSAQCGAWGFYTQSGSKTSYSVTFSTVSGTSATIRFVNVNTDNCDANILAPQAMSGGMPDSFSRTVSLSPNTLYKVCVTSTSKVEANGYIKIFGVANSIRVY